MSLDVYLEIDRPHDAQPRKAIFVRRDGAIVEITREEWEAMHPGREPVMAIITPNPGDPDTVFTRNITHNLGNMARASDLYRALWHPESLDAHLAWQLVEPLSLGLGELLADPVRYRRLDPPNGWGDYDGLVSFVTAYLAACREFPDARVRVSR
jgi:hypothetical protein